MEDHRYKALRLWLEKLKIEAPKDTDYESLKRELLVSGKVVFVRLPQGKSEPFVIGVNIYTVRLSRQRWIRCPGNELIG